MNPNRVQTQEEFETDFKRRGFVKTETRTATGVFWKSTQNDKHVLVPDAYEGMYPNFILADLEEQIHQIGQKPVH